MQNKVIQFDLALFILTKYGVYVNQKHKKTAAVQIKKMPPLARTAPQNIPFIARSPNQIEIPNEICSESRV